jgi:hypothetical protein
MSRGLAPQQMPPHNAAARALRLLVPRRCLLRWLDATEGDRATELLLRPSVGRCSGKDGGGGGMHTYLVAISTSDIKFAGTDANVFVELLGSRWGQQEIGSSDDSPR